MIEIKKFYKKYCFSTNMEGLMSDERKQTEEKNPLAVRQQGTLVPSKGKKLPGKEVISDLTCRKLIQEAEEARKHSYAPYSSFHVGACLLAKSKKTYTGCNIENVAFSPTNCAERTAFFKAVSEGEREFSAIAIVGGKKSLISDYCSPCGVCRQVMMEFCDPDSFFVILAKSEADYWIYPLADLLPMGFTPEQL